MSQTWGIFSSKFCLFRENFPTRRKVSDKVKFRGGATAQPCHDVTDFKGVVHIRVAGKTDFTACGRRSRMPNRAAKGIIGGREAIPHSWPWQCAVMEYYGLIMKCGCSIVTDEWVITAAHCKYAYTSVCLWPKNCCFRKPDRP